MVVQEEQLKISKIWCHPEERSLRRPSPLSMCGDADSWMS